MENISATQTLNNLQTEHHSLTAAMMFEVALSV